MNDQITGAQLRALLESAESMALIAAEAHRQTEAPREDKADLVEARVMLEFLIDKELLDLSEYGEWLELGLALYHDHGDAGFELWNRLSANAPNYDEAAAQRKWASFAAAVPPDKPVTLKTFYKRAREGGWKPQTKPSEDAQKSGNLKADPAAVAVELAAQAGDEFWLDQQGRPHVSYDSRVGELTVRRHARIDSETYRDLLGARYHRALGTKTLSKDQAKAAARLLSYRAAEGERHTASLRVAALDGGIYVDLGREDGRAVHVTTDGWAVVDNPPIRFVRGSRGELPDPEPGGTLADFNRHLNLSDRDIVRAVAFMLGTFNDEGSFPILFIEGEQGTGKSMLADMILACVDPPRTAKGARVSFNSDERELHLFAQGARVLSFDNVSTFSAAAADALSRMATGASSQRRTLFTDDEENWMVVIRPMMITCIGLPSSRPDLLDRSLWIEARSIERRRSEAKVRAAFLADRAKLFGFVLTCVSAALRNAEDVDKAVEAGLIQLPRMADFAQFVEGAAGSLGLSLGEFSAMIADDQSKLQRRSAQDDPVGAALIAYFSRPNTAPLEGPASAILEKLRPYVAEAVRLPFPNKFGNFLKRIAPGLRRLGIRFEQQDAEGHANVLTFRIWPTNEFVALPRPASSGPF